MRELGLLKGTKFSLELSPSVSHRPDTRRYLPFCCDLSSSFVLVLTLLYILGEFMIRIHGKELFHSFTESILTARYISNHVDFVCFKIGSSNGQTVKFLTLSPSPILQTLKLPFRGQSDTPP